MKRNLLVTVTAFITTVASSFALVACGNGEKDNEAPGEAEFGYYPQTEVKDETILSTLNEAAGDLPEYIINAKDQTVQKDDPKAWTAYDYSYTTSNSKGTIITPHDDHCMYYIDIDLNKDGQNDYRGVFIRKSREDCDQTKNGYFSEGYYGDLYTGSGTASGVYWFKYEPITWQVMEKDGDNYVLKSKLILDAQPIDYEFLAARSPNNWTFAWEKSTLRTWLNDTFYNTAFSANNKEAIVKSTVDNATTVRQNDGKKYFETELYAGSANTEDFVYIPGLKEWIDWYGVLLSETCTLPEKTCHVTNISDYSIAQGGRAVDTLGMTNLTGTPLASYKSDKYDYDQTKKYGGVALRSGSMAVAENGNFSKCGDNSGGALFYSNTATSTGVCPMITVKKSSVALKSTNK